MISLQPTTGSSLFFVTFWVCFVNASVLEHGQGSAVLILAEIIKCCAATWIDRHHVACRCRSSSRVHSEKVFSIVTLQVLFGVSGSYAGVVAFVHPWPYLSEHLLLVCIGRRRSIIALSDQRSGTGSMVFKVRGAISTGVPGLWL